MQPIFHMRGRKSILSSENLLGISEMSARDILHLLDLAEDNLNHLRRGTIPTILKGKLIVNLFLENSTRTRLSFEIAAKRLGAEVVNMTTDGSSIKKGESFIDTLKTIGAMRPDGLIIRHSEEGSARKAVDILSCPVINAGDGTNEHPTQAALDALTLRRHFGKLEGLHVVICGDIMHSRVAHSNGLLLRKMGAEVIFTGPKELLPPGLEGATTSFEDALVGADAVMALRIQKERLQNRLSFTEKDYFDLYGLTHERMKLAAPHAVVLHPGPMNRGVEISSELADDENRSLITAQVECGVAVRIACLELLLQHRN